jgi:hypothetical protein
VLVVFVYILKSKLVINLLQMLTPKEHGGEEKVGGGEGQLGKIVKVYESSICWQP